jgi:hypothetical protein
MASTVPPAQPRGDELIGSCCPSHTPVGEDEHLGRERLAVGDPEPSRARPVRTLRTWIVTTQTGSCREHG